MEVVVVYNAHGYDYNVIHPVGGMERKNVGEGIRDCSWIQMTRDDDKNKPVGGITKQRFTKTPKSKP
jgi:hypothetical protein